MRQEHNQAHRTRPVPHSGSLCAPSCRVPTPRFNAPETVRGPVEKRIALLIGSQSGLFPNWFCFFGLVRPLRARVLLSVLASMRALCLIFLSQGAPFVGRVCSRCRSSVRQIAFDTHDHHSLFVLSVYRQVLRVSAIKCPLTGKLPVPCRTHKNTTPLPHTVLGETRCHVSLPILWRARRRATTPRPPKAPLLKQGG